MHSTLAYHWARLIELLYAAERAVEPVRDPEITSKDVWNKPGNPGEEVGVVEAARGTLIHIIFWMRMLWLRMSTLLLLLRITLPLLVCRCGTLQKA